MLVDRKKHAPNVTKRVVSFYHDLERIDYCPEMTIQIFKKVDVYSS
jgi:hypothetical protein